MEDWFCVAPRCPASSSRTFKETTVSQEPSSLDAESQNAASQSSKAELYPPKDSGPMNNLPNRSIQTLADPGVRTHGAAAVSDAVYWSGHITGLVLVAVALVLVVWGGGPRKTDAMERLWQQKQQMIKPRDKSRQ
jgi:hypothetical protein